MLTKQEIVLELVEELNIDLGKIKSMPREERRELIFKIQSKAMKRYGSFVARSAVLRGLGLWV